MSTTQDSAMQKKDGQDRRVDRDFPLSLAQERIWVSEQLADVEARTTGPRLCSPCAASWTPGCLRWL